MIPCALVRVPTELEATEITIVGSSGQSLWNLHMRESVEVRNESVSFILSTRKPGSRMMGTDTTHLHICEVGRQAAP